MKKQEWIPDSQIYYMYPLNLFKCVLPMEEELDGYHQLIKDAATSDIASTLEENGIMTSAEVFKSVSKLKKLRKKSVFGIKDDSKGKK